MKILVECLWGPEAGSIFTYGMASGLLENGHDVCCILSEDMREHSYWTETFDPSRLSFIRTTPKKKRPVSTSAVFLTDCMKAKRKFSGIVFDMAIRTFSHPFDIAALRFAKFSRLVSVCHDPITHSSMDSGAARQYQDEMRKADDIIVLTRSFIPVIQSRYGKKPSQIHYMRHGIMNYPHAASSARKSPGDGINFLFFGRIEGYKGLHILAEAYRKAAERYSNVTLTVAGSGSFDAYREEFAALPNTTVVNRYIQDEEISAFFDTGNTVVVLPYIDATQSGVIPIAFDFGVPVIASNTGGLAEQLCDGQYGILFESGSSESLAEAMSVFPESPARYEAESLKMREGKERLQWKNVTRDLLEQWK